MSESTITWTAQVFLASLDYDRCAIAGFSGSWHLSKSAGQTERSRCPIGGAGKCADTLARYRASVDLGSQCAVGWGYAYAYLIGNVRCPSDSSRTGAVVGLHCSAGAIHKSNGCWSVR